MRRNFVLATSLAAVVVILPFCAQAQNAPQQPPAASGRSDDPLSGISFSLDVSEKESKSGASIAGFFSKPTPEERASSGQRTSLGWKLAVEVPIGGTDDLLDRATIDRLGQGTKISGAITFLSYKSNPAAIGSSAFMAVMERAKRACRSKAEAGTEPGTERDAALADCNYYGPSPSYILKHLPSAQLAMQRALFTGYWSGGLKGSASFKRYDWVNAGTLAKNSSKPTGYSATVWMVYYPSDAVSAWKFESEYASAPKQADAVIVCKTVVVTPNDDCVKAAPSAPTRKESLIVRGEYRRYFPFSTGKGGIGAALTGSLDTLNGDYGFELPVYLTLPQTTDVLPGIKLGYSSKKDDFTVSLFIKTSFSF